MGVYIYIYIYVCIYVYLILPASNSLLLEFNPNFKLMQKMQL